MEEIFLKDPRSNNLNGSWEILEWLINEGDIVQIEDKILRLDDGKFYCQ